jgi:hypothetical protein
MVEVGIAEYFGMAEALGIIATLFVVYFLRKQMQSLSVALVESPVVFTCLPDLILYFGFC